MCSSASFDKTQTLHFLCFFPALTRVYLKTGTTYTYQPHSIYFLNQKVGSPRIPEWQSLSLRKWEWSCVLINISEDNPQNRICVSETEEAFIEWKSCGSQRQLLTIWIKKALSWTWTETKRGKKEPKCCLGGCTGTVAASTWFHHSRGSKCYCVRTKNPGQRYHTGLSENRVHVN